MKTIAPEYQGLTPKPRLKLRTLATGLAVMAALGGCATQSTTGRSSENAVGGQYRVRASIAPFSGIAQQRPDPARRNPDGCAHYRR